MNEARRRRLEAKGWRFGTVKEFLGLSDEETAYIELKFQLAQSIREKRGRRRLGQAALAKLVGSSQSRVAKMEAGDDSVSLDLLIRTLLALGTSNMELARIISRSHSPTAA